MKTCPKCSLKLPVEAFPKSKARPDGLGYMCRKCAVLATQSRQKTQEGLVKKIYHNQRMTTGKMGRPAPNYSEKELYDWAVSKGLEQMWQTWRNSGYDRWLSPSVDRLDNNLSYSLNNIQLVTWRENLNNQKAQNRAGTHLHPGSKGVDQLTLEGDFIRSYPSAAIASRAMVGHNRNISNITLVCHGKWPTAYGHKWRFTPLC